MSRVGGAVVGAFASAFRGWGHGYRRLAETHAASVAGDALVGVVLAGTLLFSVPSVDARGKVALYLLLTLAPFAVVGPVLARVFERAPGAYRAGMILSSIGRAVVALAIGLALDTIWLFPLAFGLLVLSRFHGISRVSVLPVVVRDTDELIDANARLARAGVLSALVVVPVGAAAMYLLGPWIALFGAMAMYVVSAVAATQLPPVRLRRNAVPKRFTLPRNLRLARFATAGVRFLNGYLVFLVAFAFRDVDAGAGTLAVLLGAAGVGYFVSAWIAPTIGRHVREEPMVVGALAVLAIAAFIVAQVPSIVAASVLAVAAGFGWGTAKFAFDAMMHAELPESVRGRAFTNAETMFQIAWVIGALIPVLPFWPTTLGLSSAGVLALIIQVAYVSLVLVPEAVRVPSVHIDLRESETVERPGVLDLI